MASAQGDCPFHSHTNLKANHVIFHNGQRYDLCGPCFRQVQRRIQMEELAAKGHTMTKEEQEEAMWGLHG